MEDQKVVRDERLRAAVKKSIHKLEWILASEDVMVCDMAGSKIENVISRLAAALRQED